MAPHAFRVAVVISMLAPAFAARAEGKCGDDPYRRPDGTLVVTWAIQYPKAALSRFGGTSVFDAMDAQLGGPFPPGYGGPRDASPVNLYPDVDLPDVEAFLNWSSRHNLQVPDRAKKLLARFVPETPRGKPPNTKRPYSIRGAQVEHPPLEDPQGWNICTCVLQRGVLIFDRGQEDLWIRSTFRTDKGNDTRAFVPTDSWWYSFRSEDEIWFPLAFNEVQPKESWLVLDILSPTQFRPNPDWGEYRNAVSAPKLVTLFAKPYYAVRIQMAFPARPEPKPGAPPEPQIKDFSIHPTKVLQ